MILMFYPAGKNTAPIPFGMICKEYDLCDGSLSVEKDQITGYYSAEAFLNDLETVLRNSDSDLVVIRRLEK